MLESHCKQKRGGVGKLHIVMLVKYREEGGWAQNLLSLPTWCFLNRQRGKQFEIAATFSSPVSFSSSAGERRRVECPAEWQSGKGGE